MKAENPGWIRFSINIDKYVDLENDNMIAAATQEAYNEMMNIAFVDFEQTIEYGIGIDDPDEDVNDYIRQQEYGHLLDNPNDDF